MITYHFRWHSVKFAFQEISLENYQKNLSQSLAIQITACIRARIGPTHCYYYHYYLFIDLFLLLLFLYLYFLNKSFNSYDNVIVSSSIYAQNFNTFTNLHSISNNFFMGVNFCVRVHSYHSKDFLQNHYTDRINSHLEQFL